MAAATDEPGLTAFFHEMSELGGIIVKETPKLDLDLYIQNYRGRTRLDRLLTIGRCCVPLCVEALKAAVAEAKSGRDVERYREIWECIRVAAPAEPEAVFDQAWADKTTMENRQQTHHLETQLKGYKNNLIKESIRHKIGNEELGRHYENIGDLNAASDAYTRMRPDVSTSKHIIDLGKHLVDLAVMRRDWSMVLGNLTKITGMQSEEEKSLQTYAKIVQGIALMNMEKFSDAARSFLQIDIGKEVKDGVESNNIASPNDVAVYGGLLALATMDRKDLQKKVLDNQNFRTCLELEPHIRKASRSLGSLNEAFAARGTDIQVELATMIKSGLLQARINTIDQLLVAVNPNQRAAMQTQALETTKAYESEALERIRRMGLLSANLEVRNVKKLQATGSQTTAADGVSDVWFDNSGEPMAIGAL
ncbi:COP9 signalosome complex subunit 1 [Verticillium alfalfae VaMs.102]|uniref:COP9 signalosome complex subunit 1 n=1 Tax=Verticillium alfalfae (strain VaMs.102 / ATCC MYA-4576 / FGSC 10136) TaxID=526221 RepID=C9SC85_VERA1|nr:COP9 signalosome complex subunit 1 [Verticillium alfalfae VaMs.102]EEY16700.1 COP9 signalosome complex subunit 1 [Verticillium alfalfae VaMs.102]